MQMDNDGYLYHYTFPPTKLRAAREVVEHRYGDVDKDNARRLAPYRLPKLLEFIRRTPTDELETWAVTLKKSDVMVLLYQYPYPDETQDTQRKVNIVLSKRFTSSMGRYLWGLFSHDYEHVYLQDLLRRVYPVDSYAFLNPGQDTREALVAALSNRSGIAYGLIPFFTTSKKHSKELLKSLQIKEDCPIEHFLLFEMLLAGLQYDVFIRREGEASIQRKLEKYPLEHYQQLMKVYLEARTYETFHGVILEEAIKRLHDPRERMVDWTFLSEKALSDVKRWLVVNELRKFFEGDNNRRFEYWKRYLHYIDNVTQLRGNGDPKVAFIYFRQFVVVEFGNIGSAYFYHREGFDNWILSRTTSHNFRRRSTNVKESLLKETARTMRGDPLFINKEGHFGYYETWSRKFTRHMQEYLAGNFDYSEG
ncbi:hypothetical protein AB6A23_03695 [Paenibacillus tarimensis]